MAAAVVCPIPLPSGYRVTCSAAEVAARVARYAAAPLRVASLWQPWASLVVAHDPAWPGVGRGAKGLETRSWRPQGDGPIPVVIHACQRWAADTSAALASPPFVRALRRTHLYHGDPRPFTRRAIATPGEDRRFLPLGALVGVAVVERWDPAPSIAAALRAGEQHEELAFGNYDAGRWGWRLADVLELPAPIPFRGMQRALYLLDEGTRAEVLDQLHALAARVGAEEDAG